MDGVKSQAGHIRGTISNLEGQRDEAISERDAARSQLQVGHLANISYERN